jgi:protoporphyrinogen oxidase
MKKVIVIGAGISGLSISRMLADDMDVTVLEKSIKPGGLIKCDRINGALFHKVGGHVFNSKNPAVLNWFWQHFEKDVDFIQTKRNARILLFGKLIGYPLENYLYQLPKEFIVPIVNDLVGLLVSVPKPSASSNFKDFLVNTFGKTLYELYFGPYNSKIWDTDISKIPLEWLDGKLPMPSVTDIISNNIERSEESEMVHSHFYYPLNNGSQFIVDRLAEGQNITLDYEVVSIKENLDGHLVVNDDYVVNYLIYCGDIRQLSSIINIDDDNLNRELATVKDLLSNGTSNVLCETDEMNVSWLYLPEMSYKAHRIIYTGSFSETNNANGKRKTCVVEFSGKHTEASMKAELGLLPGNLKPIAFNYEPNSYIIHNITTRNHVNNLKVELARYNIFLLGRFAEWEYYNMDKCIERAIELSDKIKSR